MSDTSADYLASRARYWAEQEAFREASQAEMQRLMPADVATVVMDFNDADPPRLTVVDLLDAGGESLMGKYDASDEYEVLDQIACDMEYRDWHEASASLFYDRATGEKFIIEREG